MSTDTKERKLRESLRMMGYQLRKSRARRCSIDNQLGYMIICPQLNACIAGTRYDLTLEDVEAFLAE